MPFDVMVPSAGSGSGDAVTARSYEIDLRGSGGSLSNGSVTLGGYPFTLAGIGASSGLGTARIPLSSLYADYDGAVHSVEVCAYVPAISLGEGSSYVEMIRIDPTFTYWNTMSAWTSGPNYIEASSNVDGTYSRVFRQENTTYSTFTRWGLSAVGGTTAATWGTGSKGAFRAAAQADQRDLAVYDQPTYTQRFGATDLIALTAASWSTGSAGASITQTAAGLVVAYGATSFTVQNLYVYIGTPEIP